MKQKNSNNFSCKKIRSFTLIELLVVIAIVGILAGIIIVSMAGATEKAIIAKSQVFSGSLKSSMGLNIISEFNFNEGSGTAIKDSWGENNGILACTGASCWKSGTDCIDGSCLLFDGGDGNDTVTVSSSASLNSPIQTIEAWVKMDIWSNSTKTITRINGNDKDWYYLFYGGGGSAIENTLYSLVYYTNTSNVDTNYVYPNKLMSLGAWHHLALTLKSNGKAILYVDGALADTRTATNFSHWGKLNAATSNTNLVIGNSLKSSIDNLRIYSSEMTISQAKQQYIAGLGNY